MSPSVQLDRQRGFTLMETVVALGIAAALMVVLGNILLSSTQSVDYVVTDSIMDQEMKRGLNRLFQEIQSSSPSTISIVETNPDHDVLTFQVPAPWDGVAVRWGATDDDDVFHEGWHVRYQVVQGDLVRGLLNTAGIPTGTESLVLRRIDASRDGQKGFRVTRVNTLITVLVRSGRQFRDGVWYGKDFTSSVHLMN